jgi:hypothetical protein
VPLTEALDPEPEPEPEPDPELPELPELDPQPTTKLASTWYFPTIFLDGNGTGRLHLDEAATADQRRELEAIFRGKKGGPVAPLEGLITTWLPTVAVPIAIREAGDTLTATVGRFGQVQVQRLRNQKGRPTTMQAAGFASQLEIDTLEMAPSASEWTDPDLPRRFGTKSGILAKLNWKAS